MILIDTNLLLYAYDPSRAQHSSARSWLESALSASEPVRLPWTAVLAFLRISTDPRIQRPAASMADAVSVVSSWFEQPSVATLDPGERHWAILRGLMDKGHVRGRLVMDAHIAALAIEYGATLCTADKEFTRFPGLKLLYPLDRG